MTVIEPTQNDLGRAATLERPTFEFVDLFAGIGGMRAGLQLAGGVCRLVVENDDAAIRTYAANWGPVKARNIREVSPTELEKPDILAAGFPCQPFSLAGVVKKQSLGRAHGFADRESGNLFFEIVRLIGGPFDLSASELTDEAESPDDQDPRFEGTPLTSMPPVLLLENVRHLLSHDEGRTFRVIRRRLMRSGYHVSSSVINAASWVPQNRRRTFIVGLRRDLFDKPFPFPVPPPTDQGPKLDLASLAIDADVLRRYRLTPGVWEALKRHKSRHEASGNGFGYGISRDGGVTRTLSARYYKDGAEILIRMKDGKDPPRRLTPRECAYLMGFTKEQLGKTFEIPVSDVQAYRQFGNAVVVPQVAWLGKALVAHCRSVLVSLRQLPSAA